MRILVAITVSLIAVSACIGVGMKFQEDENYVWGLWYVAGVFVLLCVTMRGMYYWGKEDGRSLLRNMDFFMRKHDRGY